MAENRGQSPGLSPDEARARLARSGPNRLFTPAPVRFWAIAWEEIREPMILLLLVVGVLYSLWGKPADALTIFFVILLLVGAEVGNEFRAKRAVGALEQLSAPKARVRRGGEALLVDTESVVPGDLLLLVPGARIPADARLTSGVDVAVDESALTGESLPASKAAGDVVFAGTVVVSGEGEAEATVTGSATRLGQMAAQLATVKPPRTPLQLAMKSLAGKLVWVAIAFAVLIPLIGVLRGGELRQMILTGLALAFAVIPEELPIVITMVLALGAYQLSRKHLLVKRLRAAETMGDATVILTDKTGTLTENRMQVVAAWPATEEPRILATALGTVSPEMPDALEQAVTGRARALGIAASGSVLRLRHQVDGRRSKAALWRLPDGSQRLYVTGAPEEILARCRAVPAGVPQAIAAETGQGRRVVAAATRDVVGSADSQPLEELEQGLDFAGIIALADPPRTGVQETIARLARAGIRTIMVTGDHPVTAAAIARAVGIPADRVLTGEELAAIDDAQLARVVGDVSVFARTTPEAKHRLLVTLQHNGEVVLVTGDGVNDALVLKAADVGVAMGLRGTDVAKEAAQVVLADDDYSTLARGIFEGRHFFDNVRKGIGYYLAVKVALVLVFLVPVLAGLPLPFSPIQIILLEMFMDLAASAGFVGEPAEGDVTTRRPRNTATALLDGPVVRRIFLKGFLLFVAVMAAYAWARSRGFTGAEVQSCAFAAWMVGHVALAFLSRSDREPLLRHGVFTNRVMNVWALAAIAVLLAAVYVPGLRQALRFAAVPAWALAISAGLALLLVSPAELGKGGPSDPGAGTGGNSASTPRTPGAASATTDSGAAAGVPAGHV